jgi:hypothetical protein
MKWAVIGLALALVGTNAWWLYRAIDSGVTAMYREQTCTEHQEALVQSLAVIRLAKGRHLRKEMVETARAALPESGEPFDKDGETVVGRLALKFDQDGAFVDVHGP